MPRLVFLILVLSCAVVAYAETLRGIIYDREYSEVYYARMTLQGGVPTSDWLRVARLSEFDTRDPTIISAYQDGIYIVVCVL
jgi:hypothetical protein